MRLITFQYVTVTIVMFYRVINPLSLSLSQLCKGLIVIQISQLGDKDLSIYLRDDHTLIGIQIGCIELNVRTRLDTYHRRVLCWLGFYTLYFNALFLSSILVFFGIGATILTHWDYQWSPVYGIFLSHITLPGTCTIWTHYSLNWHSSHFSLGKYITWEGSKFFLFC